MEFKFNKDSNMTDYLRYYSPFISLIAVILLFKVSMNEQEKSLDIIRVKGIIVEDENGKERILIGAPVPYAENRVRTDSTRVKEIWGPMFPKEYMSWYKDYSHENYGILILDENGHDRIAMGDPTPDPNIGKRIGPASGITINDSKGFERSGWGVLDVNGRERVVLGLDGTNGREAVSLVVFENGTTGLVMNGPEYSLFLGAADSTNWYTDDLPFKGLHMKNKKGQDFLFNTMKPAKD